MRYVSFSLGKFVDWGVIDSGEWKCGCDFCGTRVPERSEFCIESGF